jgi:DNA-binding transcriptional ArsR family regulator
MVKYNEAQLDRTFAALADPTRRAMLARLSLGTLSVSELAEPFDMTLPAVMKHLTVLTEAGLVLREKSGRTVSCELQAKPMEDAVKWLSRYQKFWSDTLDRLAAFVEEEAWQPSSTPGQASSSAATSRRRRPPSSPPGRTRKK